MPSNPFSKRYVKYPQLVQQLHKEIMIAGIILAAGESRRMGVAKALLKINQQTFLDHIVSQIRKSSLGTTLVVLGHQAEQIKAETHLEHERVVINSGFRNGQLSSLQAGIRTLENQEDIEAAMVFLVDHPLINALLINELIDRFGRHKDSIIVPTYKRRRGHPVIFPRTVFSDLLHAPLEEGARSVLRSQKNKVVEIETDDEAILLDIDTRDQYRKLVAGG